MMMMTTVFFCFVLFCLARWLTRPNRLLVKLLVNGALPLMTVVVTSQHTQARRSANGPSQSRSLIFFCCRRLIVSLSASCGLFTLFQSLGCFLASCFLSLLLLLVSLATLLTLSPSRSSSGFDSDPLRRVFRSAFVRFARAAPLRVRATRNEQLARPRSQLDLANSYLIMWLGSAIFESESFPSRLRLALMIPRRRRRELAQGAN